MESTSHNPSETAILQSKLGDNMNTDTLIKQLQKSNLYAECECGEEFKLSEAIMFDGIGKLPEAAEELRKQLTDELAERMEALKKRKFSADEGAEKKAIEVGVGKCLEKIMPACKGFTTPLSECRPLFEPIDMVLFNGMSVGKIESLTFMEIKTGASRLSAHQKMIRDAINDKEVSFRWYK